MYTYAGKTALVTGASSGIGEAFVKELARRKMNLMLVARDEAALQTLAAKLTAEQGIRADVVAADLSQEASATRIAAEVARLGVSIDLLVNNAGFMTYGHFETNDPATERAEVMVNVAAVVDLCHAFVPGMLSRGEGAIINLASIVAFQPVPYMAVYSGTKAFVVSFSMALAEELRGRGVRVVTLCPGPTATKFFERSNSAEVIRVGSHKPDAVVKTALRALEQGRGLIVDGWKNTLMTYCSSVLPRAFTARMAAQQTRPPAK
ncbi:SDR family NAD(P)-dependent oxidoreductase [Anatilimnocola sp. NA78]|uniref:SDR family NAD(P)-dependent oxidoreductase n=1 Tax=Anatilimnocola sp. NA78 TaxID=3415683 RepID=UPI003CE55D0E